MNNVIKNISYILCLLLTGCSSIKQTSEDELSLKKIDIDDYPFSNFTSAISYSDASITIPGTLCELLYTDPETYNLKSLGLSIVKENEFLNFSYNRGSEANSSDSLVIYNHNLRKSVKKENHYYKNRKLLKNFSKNDCVPGTLYEFYVLSDKKRWKLLDRNVAKSSRIEFKDSCNTFTPYLIYNTITKEKSIMNGFPMLKEYRFEKRK